MNVGGPALHALLLNERLDPARATTPPGRRTVGAAEGDYLTLHGAAPERLRVRSRARPGGRRVAGLVGPLVAGPADAVVPAARRHTHTSKAGALGRIAATLCRVPVVVHTYHGHVFDAYFSPLKSRLVVAAERVLARGASALVAVTARVRRDVLARGIGGDDQVVVVALGLDLDPLVAAPARRGELRRELGLPPDAPVVGIVARLVPVKAHEVFLAAAKAMAPVRPDIVFLIVGDGERRAELETAARASGLGDRVRFLGWRADLDRLYADLDVVVLTSKNELTGCPDRGDGAGRPWSRPRGGVEDVITDGETGVVVPIGDAPAIARAVVDLLEDPARAARLGAAARASVVARFGGGLVGDIDALYQRLLADRGVRGV
jgi:glycosyltransferase involved in cell wall biosynthesis